MTHFERLVEACRKAGLRVGLDIEPPDEPQTSRIRTHQPKLTILVSPADVSVTEPHWVSREVEAGDALNTAALGLMTMLAGRGVIH